MFGIGAFAAAASLAKPDPGTVRVREIPDEVETLKLDQIAVRRHVGGLVSSFERRAA